MKIGPKMIPKNKLERNAIHNVVDPANIKKINHALVQKRLFERKKKRKNAQKFCKSEQKNCTYQFTAQAIGDNVKVCLKKNFNSQFLLEIFLLPNFTIGSTHKFNKEKCHH